MFAVSFHMMCCSHTGAPTGTLLFDSGSFRRVAAKMKVASLFGALVASAISLVAAEVKVGFVCWSFAPVGFSSFIPSSFSSLLPISMNPGQFFTVKNLVCPR